MIAISDLDASYVYIYSVFYLIIMTFLILLAMYLYHQERSGYIDYEAKWTANILAIYLVSLESGLIGMYLRQGGRS